MNKDRWQKMSFAQQLGNVGSEICRARLGEEKNSGEQRRNALTRAIDLLDLMISDVRWRKRLKELLRFREVLGSLYVDRNPYHVVLQRLEKYCLYPTLAEARSVR